MVKNLPANAEDTRDLGSVSGSGRSPGKGNGCTLQYCSLENSTARGSLVGYNPWGHERARQDGAHRGVYAVVAEAAGWDPSRELGEKRVDGFQALGFARW